MPDPFSVLTTPAFEREFRKASKGNAKFIDALEELIATLREDPYNFSGQNNIMKLAGVKPGEGKWRIGWREYRLRHDIMAKRSFYTRFDPARTLIDVDKAGGGLNPSNWI